MGEKDKRVDAYIANAADFARPILTHLREVVHAACPDVVEAIKWGMPAFEHKGPMCGMAAFKAHATFGFWKHDLIVGDDPKALAAMGSFGRVESTKDLPSKSALIKLVRKACKLNDEGIKSERPKRSSKPAPKMHPDLKAALTRNKRAATTFADFAPSHKREYLEWIAEAKQDATRARRVAQAIEWLAEGKSRHWKYQKKG
jgi:hypothetical protein